MTSLIIGLIIFLAVHSTRIVAEGWRSAQVSRMGELPWKAIYSLLSLLGFALLVWGYGQSRGTSPTLWNPPLGAFHLTSLLTLPAFILMVAGYVPGNRLKATLGHPMVAGVALWALAHLISNGRLGDVVLFGAFFIWAVVDFLSSRQRDRVAGRTYGTPSWTKDVIVLVVGIAAWGLFAGYLHERLIGVRPY